MLVAGAGMVLAAASTLLAWAEASSGGFSANVKPFDEGVRFRIADWLSSDIKIDGLAVLLVAMLGLTVLGFALSGRMSPRRAGSTAASLGSVLIAVGGVEIQFVSTLPGPWGTGMGLYLLIAGGALAIVSQFLPAKRLGG